MKLQSVAYILALLSLGNALSHFIPIMTAGLLHEIKLLPSLFLSLGLSLLIPVVLFLFGVKNWGKKVKLELGHKESFLIVAGGWLLMALSGSLPYYFSGSIPNFTDAFFESMSGYTTTGASILTDIEAMPKTLLLWRSFTHWIGGMGIMVFTLALLPALGIGGLQMFKAEVPGPIPDKLAPQVKQTAIILWRVYLILTIIELLLLILAGMDFFDAINHAFATLATGGFSTKNDSAASFSPLVQWIITVFMIIAGTNFSLHYLAMRGNFKSYLRDAEFRFYLLGIILASALIISYSMLTQIISTKTIPGAGNLEEISRHAFFQVASIVTSTGFASFDYEQWPAFVQIIIFLLMFLGGCAGSTGGGIKQMRILLLIKVSFDEIRQLIHPRGVFNAKINGRPIQIEVQKTIVAFVIIYLFIFASSVLVVSLWDIDMITSITVVLASLGNIGPGFGLIGPSENYAWLPNPIKWHLTLLMLMGRLEIFPVLVLFTPATWQK